MPGVLHELLLGVLRAGERGEHLVKRPAEPTRLVAAVDGHVDVQIARTGHRRGRIGEVHQPLRDTLGDEHTHQRGEARHQHHGEEGAVADVLERMLGLA